MKKVPDKLETFQESIGYHFKTPSLLCSSLTHPSYFHQYPDTEESNQRLEFLGDAVLSTILADDLYERLSGEREGVLSLNRAALAQGAQLAALARELGLGAVLRLGEGEIKNKGRRRESILEDALEALIGAIFLDSDWNTTRRVVLNWYGDISDRLETLLEQHNPKGRLQELVQPVHGNEAIEYVVASTSGPDHAKSYTVEAHIMGSLMGEGRGSSKKEAEENAASAALLRWPDKPQE